MGVLNGTWRAATDRHQPIPLILTGTTRLATLLQRPALDNINSRIYLRYRIVADAYRLYEGLGEPAVEARREPPPPTADDPASTAPGARTPSFWQDLGDGLKNLGRHPVLARLVTVGCPGPALRHRLPEHRFRPAGRRPGLGRRGIGLVAPCVQRAPPPPRGHCRPEE
ncbi:hypothetical protein [Streptomyces sp. NPDC046939]|uniref:hypothetical protein n=1 Tax=Streptomyces sp. NPDC046939 TaxID=3155376 RepID=UPI0033E2CBD6